MGIAPEVSLVVKHTFLEFIRTPDHKSRRARSFSDTELFESCGAPDKSPGTAAVVAAGAALVPAPAKGSGGDSSQLPATATELPSGDAALSLSNVAELRGSPGFGPSESLALAWPVTPVLEAVFEPEALTERGELVDLEATMEVKAVLGMSAGTSPCQMAACGKEPSMQPPHQWLPPSAIQMLDAEDPSQMQDHSMVFQQPWVFVPYADFTDCCQLQGPCWADAGMWQPDTSLEDASTASSSGTPSAGDISSYDPLSARETRTTVMLRNLPNTLTRDALLRVLEAMGFRGQYDLVYIPVDFSSGAGLGYAFINVVSSSSVPRLWDMFDGFSEWGDAGDKVCTVSWSDPHQGLPAHIERYQNSPVMHPDVPDEWKPALFVHGVRVEFPPPTRKLKAPKVRSKKLEVSA